jgi:hypothetical protein
MNSDAYPRDELPDALSIDEDIAVLLTDTTDGGMLLGRRFWSRLAGNLLSAQPMAVSLNPLRALGRRGW